MIMAMMMKMRKADDRLSCHPIFDDDEEEEDDCYCDDDYYEERR